MISEKIPLQDVPLTTFLIDKPELIEDIQRIMKIVGYWDPGINANICVTTDDKIAFIDTEPYPDDHNFIVQPVLDLLFFRLQKRGEVTANKLQLMVEQAKNPHLYKKQSIFKTAGKYALYSLALYTAIKIVKNKIA